MNFCILNGKITEKIDFRFMYNSKKISVAKTKIRLNNDSIINVKGYDEMADWMYRFLDIDDSIMITGRINTNMEIEVMWMRKL